MAPRLLSGKEIIQQPLPDLRVDKRYRTTSQTTQKLWFTAYLSQWNIEQKARQYSDSINWKDDIQSYESDKERLFCGDEHSVVARFNQNLCHTLTLALHGYAFTKVPDIALITDEHDLCVVGEAKTPWNHDIVRQQRVDAKFRNFVGQIALYMHKTKRKYGFLTTYDQTMFSQQVPHPKKKNAWVLCHSPVIHHDAKYEQVTEDKSDNPAYYRGKVTLAECFLYLAKRASEGRRAVNSMEATSWVGTNSSAVGMENDGYISVDEESNSEEEYEESSSGEESEKGEKGEKDEKGQKDQKEKKDEESSSRRMTRSATRRLNANPNINTL